MFTSSSHLTAQLGIDTDGGEEQLALHGPAWVELGDLDHVDQLEQLLDDLLEWCRLDVDDDRDPAAALFLGGCDGEREDVVPAAGEQTGDTGEHARPVLHEHGEDVMGRLVHRSDSLSRS